MLPDDTDSTRDTASAETTCDAKLLELAMNGDRAALGHLLAIHRERLKLLVEIRIDRRLRQRMDDSDVLQELFLRIHRQAAKHTQVSSAYVWLRRLTIWTLGDLQRKHLGIKQRDARRELPLAHADNWENSGFVKMLVDSMALPLDQLVRAERMDHLKRSLEQLNHSDREILTLRHGEQLSRSEAAEVLGISVAAAAKRYLRALEKVRSLLKQWDSSCAS